MISNRRHHFYKIGGLQQLEKKVVKIKNHILLGCDFNIKFKVKTNLHYRVKMNYSI